MSLHEEGEILDLEERLCRPKLVSQSDSNPSGCSADLLKEIEKEFESEEKFSDHVQDSLADLVNGRFQEKQDLEHMKARFDTIHRPENCGSLIVPKMNKQFWIKLNDKMQKSDLAFARTQRAIVKSALAVTQLAEDLLVEEQSGQKKMLHAAH